MAHFDVPVDKLAIVVVQDMQRTGSALSALWQNQTAVLVFVRHFG